MRGAASAAGADARRADPLVDDISLGESARLARGERMAAGK